MTTIETLYTKNVAHELSFLLVTHTACFDIQFARYRFLKSGFRADQVLDRLVIQVFGQVFGPQYRVYLLGSEYKI
jgi:hypothetical protein